MYSAKLLFQKNGKIKTLSDKVRQHERFTAQYLTLKTCERYILGRKLNSKREQIKEEELVISNNSEKD